MKNSLTLFLLITLIIAGCNSETEEEGLVSKWHLIEMLADPGDGSGTFQPVSSDKTISFYEDGTVSSNGSICTMSVEVGSPSTGTYDAATMIIDVDDCSVGPFPLNYEMDASFLILNYPCIEPCVEKYEQVE